MNFKFFELNCNLLLKLSPGLEYATFSIQKHGFPKTTLPDLMRKHQPGSEQRESQNLGKLMCRKFNKQKDL